MNELIGKRMLLTIGSGYGAKAVEEYKVLEVSPSGNWVKLQNLYGNKFWKARAEIGLVEELKPLNADKPTS
jgi:hypothetical protein